MLFRWFEVFSDLWNETKRLYIQNISVLEMHANQYIFNLAYLTFQKASVQKLINRSMVISIT